MLGSRPCLRALPGDQRPVFGRFSSGASLPGGCGGIESDAHDEVSGVRVRAALGRPGGGRDLSGLHAEPAERQLDGGGVLPGRSRGRGGDRGAGRAAEGSPEAQLHLHRERCGVRGGLRAQDRPL